jgi:PRC-barrel domain
MLRFALIATLAAAMALGNAALADDAPSTSAAPAAPPSSGSAPPNPGAASPPTTNSPPTPPTPQPAPDPLPTSSVHRVPPEMAEAILGRQVTDAQGKDLGRLVDVLVDETGLPQAAVIDFGGFLGVGNRKVAVHWSAMHFNPAEGKHIITLDMTPDQIKSAPEYTNTDKPAPVVTPADVVPVAH